jgi:hypothetical protein
MEEVEVAGDPLQARRPVLDWVVPSRRDFVRAEQLHATVSASMVYTEGTAQYVRSGFDTQSASASYAFCSASFERQHKEREAHSSYSKTLQMIGSWYDPRATVYLQDCTRVSPNFVEAVKSALDSPNPAPALQVVFLEYGVAIPREVVLGGQLYFTHQQRVEGSFDEHQAETTIKAAVSVKAGAGSGSASTSFGSASGDAVTPNLSPTIRNSTFSAATRHVRVLRRPGRTR